MLNEIIDRLVDPEERPRLTAWFKDQRSKTPKYTGAIGGCFEYCLFPTSIGIIFTIKNAVTKDEITFNPD